MAGNFGGEFILGIGVLRGIRQYFIRQNLIAAQCDVIIIAKSYQCVYTRPVARRASLIVSIEFNEFFRGIGGRDRWEE